MARASRQGSIRRSGSRRPGRGRRRRWVSAERTRARAAIDEFLQRLPGLVLVVGKGGVGKTTCAIGIAAHLAAAGEPTLLVSTDPAGALGPALDIALADGEPQCIESMPALSAMQLDPGAARSAFLGR